MIVRNRTLLASLPFFKSNSHELHHANPYKTAKIPSTHRGHRCRRKPRFKSSESTGGDFGAPLFSRFFSYSYSASRYSYSYSKRPSIAIRPIGPQVPANRLDQRLASSQLQQPSSTSTVSLSTRTSTTKSDAMHEPRNTPPSTTIESLKPAGWISPAYPGACVWAGSVRSLGSPPVFSRGRLFWAEPKNPVTKRSVVSTNLQGTFV